MEFHRIRYFLEVAKQEQFSRAAEVCHVSQPSLSQQIQKLEEEVGGSLFLRSRGGVSLTELGKDFLPHAQGIMAEVDLARGFKDRVDGKIRRPVRVGAIPTIAPYLLPSFIKHIREVHPEAGFEVVEDTTDSLVKALRMRTIDFALLSPPTEVDREVDFLEVGDDELLLTLPEGHLLNKLDKIFLEKMKSDRLVLLKDAHCLSQQSEEVCLEAGLRADVTIQSSQIDTLLGMVELGMGFTFTPRMATPFHKHRKIKFHSIEPEEYFRKIRLVWMKGSEVSGAQKILLDCLKAWKGDVTEEDF